MKRIKIFSLIICVTPLVILCNLTPGKDETNQVFSYLTTHPQTGLNYTERMKYLGKNDEMSFSCSDTLFRDYIKSLPVDFSKKEGKILCYLDTAVNHVISVLNRKMDKYGNGVYLCHVYIMGYVVQYKNEFLGVDIICKNAKRFAKYFEVLLNSYHHADYYSDGLISSMEKMNESFISN